MWNIETLNTKAGSSSWSAVLSGLVVVIFNPSHPLTVPSTKSNQCWQVCKCGLRAGLRGFARHGGSILSGCCLDTIEATRYPKVSTLRQLAIAIAS